MTKVPLCRFKQCFGAFNMLTAHKCSGTGVFRHLINPAFCSLKLQKQIISEGLVFFQSIQIFMQFSEMHKEIQKMFFDF